MTPLHGHFGLEYAPTPFMMRLGRREVLVTRDFRSASTQSTPSSNAIPGSNLAMSKCC